ncbi:MAG TPA: regulatory iron-sulfur-containing complex subunit RicT [Gemmataceae bacterium]|jgi:cell fate regulator YaaT (PSP1 superfamily)
MDPSSPTAEAPPPPAAAPHPHAYIVRHGATRHLGEFTTSGGALFGRGSDVVVRSDRGHEVGQVLCPADPRAVGLLVEPTKGQILRPLTAEDRQRVERLREQQRTEYDVAARLIGQRRLQMELVDVEHLFGGERIIFYFLAEKRVDFRELVKDLARELQTRIELRQIGVRDEAKLKADYGDCGKPVCCNTHMAVMPPVSMRMAKLQKSTLDPTKISGRCGRLKCCLRFEQDVYEEFQQQLPAVGARVVTRKGQGRVLAHEILARRLLVEFEDGRRLPVALDDVLTKL